MQIFDHCLVDSAHLVGSQRWDRAAAQCMHRLSFL